MAEIIAAIEFGPGHAWLIFLEPVLEGSVINLSRDSETTSNLGVNGWQAQPCAITPLRIEKRGTGSKILIGPEFVDNILDGEYITVKTGELTFSEFWPSIVPAAKKHGASITDKVEKKPEVKPEPIPEVVPEVVEEPIIEDIKPGEPLNDDVKNVVDAALNGHSAGQFDLSNLQPKKSNVSTIFIVLGICLAIILIGGGAFFAFKHFSKTETTTPQITENTTPSEAPATPQEPPAEQSQLDQDFAGGQDGWNTLIQSPDTDPQRLFDLGQALREREGGNPDIGFEAIYKASQKNNKAALEWYARANDPTSDAQGANRITPPNIRRALETWTTLAKQDPSVRANITKLCDHLRDKRYSGTTEERTTFQDYCQ